MSVASPQPAPPTDGSRDAISKLRIRKEARPESSGGGKLFKLLLILILLGGVGYAGLMFCGTRGLGRYENNAGREPDYGSRVSAKENGSSDVGGES